MKPTECTVDDADEPPAAAVGLNLPVPVVVGLARLQGTAQQLPGPLALFFDEPLRHPFIPTGNEDEFGADLQGAFPLLFEIEAQRLRARQSILV